MSSSKKYLESNPTWHVEDSPWKARQILKIITNNALPVESICEIGCGAGEILNSMQKTLNHSSFVGYEISEDAYMMCQKIKNKKIRFVLGDLLGTENKDYYNIALAIDVFEHVEDYFTFLRKLKKKADFKIFHIPLDLSVQTIARASPLLRAREKVGHLHYFSKETAIETLKDCGYTILDSFYTNGSLDVPKNLKARLLNVPRRLLNMLHKGFSVRFLGGCSLMVLTR